MKPCSFYNQFGSTTNAHGDLLVSYMTPWRVNRVTADKFSLPESAHLDVDELETVPTDGAIIRLSFPINGEEADSVQKDDDTAEAKSRSPLSAG
ncbi:fimbria/pilus outer membrane usher protein [Enterobacteriaceae bacterium C23F]